jgi:iduronate 2-sulfatase
LYPLSRINLAPNRYYPINFPEVAWNPWTDLRMREDVKNLNISFPFGAIPDYFQVRNFFKK